MLSNKRGWFYHKEYRLWFTRAPNMEPLVKTNTYERGTYHCFDPSSFETVRKVSLYIIKPIFMMFFTISCFRVILLRLFPPTSITLLLASNVQPPCRIMLFFIMICWKIDLIYLSIKGDSNPLM